MSHPLPVQIDRPHSATPPGLRVLLDGLPGSGVRLLWQVLRGMQGQDYRSFARAAGLATTAPLLVEETWLAFPGATEVDPIGRRDGRWFFALPGHEVEVDLDLVFERSTLVWTRECPDAVLRELPTGHARVYLMRDGREVVDSLARAGNGGYEQLGVFEDSVREWSQHVDSYLQHGRRFTLVRYEDLRDRLPATLEVLGQTLGLEVDPLRLAARVTPRPLPMPRVRNSWRENFRAEHRGLFKAIAGETLIRLGYEDGYNW